MDNDLTLEIANAAARMVVEDGMEWGPAKKRAVKLLGAPARTALPDNGVLEEAVRDYIALFCADTQPQELQALRELALVWMERMQEFRPHLTGAVWGGVATRHSDIHIQLFCDDPKSAEIALINQGASYEVSSTSGMRGDSVDVLSVGSQCKPLGQVVGVHFIIYDKDDLRGALKPDGRGRVARGSTEALRRLLAESGAAP
ncbi:MAG: hypothetical protein ACN6O3_02385 [Comamonas sp.]